MPTLASRLLPWVLACAVLASPQVVWSDDDPVVDTPEGREAHADLRWWYRVKAGGRTETPHPYRKALGWLRAEDPERRARGGAYLLAFFLQTAHDEQHGLAPRPDGYKLGGGPQDTAAELRWLAAREFARLVVPDGGREALEPALWLLRGNPWTAVYGAQALSKVEGEESDRALREVLASPAARHAILVVAIDAVADRELRSAEPDVRRFCTHYDEVVRAAARTCLDAWDVEDVPAYEEEAGLRWVADELSHLAGALLEDPSPNEGWCLVEVTEPPWQAGGEPRVHEVHGWLRSETDDEVRVVDWFGMPRTIEAEKAQVVREALADRAAKVVAERKAWLEAAEGARPPWGAFPSNMGVQRFMRTQGTWEGSLPEALLAAWSLAAGDPASAAALLLPLLDAWDDAQAFFAYARGQLARRLDQRMLYRFVSGRYADALPVARHLAGEAFTDFEHQDRAVGLAAQLPRRVKEDFVTLDLPTPEAWRELRATLSREAAIRHLAQRIRLIRAEQGSIPGFVSYGTVQRRLLDPDDERWNADHVPLLNPYSELWEMNLAAKELPLLFDVVRSDDYVRAYDLPRFLPHWPRNLHRARWVAGTLANTVAQRNLLDRQVLGSGDAAAIEAHLAEATAWCEAEGETTLGDRLERSVAQDDDWEQVQGAVWQLNDVDPAALGRGISARLATDEEHRGELLMVAAHVGAAGAVADAREAQQHEDLVTRGWAALVLVKAGRRAEREGVDTLLEVLAAKGEPALHNAAVDALLATGDEAAVKGLLALLAPDAQQPTTMLVVQRLFLAGHPEARDFVLRLLAPDRPEVFAALPWGTGNFEKVGGPDRTTWQLGRWSRDVPRSTKDEPTEEERAVWLAAVRAWVRRTFDKVQAGEDPGIERTVVVAPFVAWSGQGRWIRRL